MDILDDDTCGMVWDRCILSISLTCKKSADLYQDLRSLAMRTLMSWSLLSRMNLFRRSGIRCNTDNFDKKYKMLVLSPKYFYLIDNLSNSTRVPCICYKFDNVVGIRIRRHSYSA